LVREKRSLRQAVMRVDAAKVCAHMAGVLAVEGSVWTGRESLYIRR
jgi:hypothetical protein